MKKTIYSLIVTLILLSGNVCAQPLLVSQENGQNNTSNTLVNIDNTVATSPFNKLVWSDEFDGYGFVNSANFSVIFAVCSDYSLSDATIRIRM